VSDIQAAKQFLGASPPLVWPSDLRNLALGVPGLDPFTDDPPAVAAGGEQRAPHDLAEVNGDAARIAPLHRDPRAVWGTGHAAAA
jgi:hypothetical protein